MYFEDNPYLEGLETEIERYLESLSDSEFNEVVEEYGLQDAEDAYSSLLATMLTERLEDECLIS